MQSIDCTQRLSRITASWSYARGRSEWNCRRYRRRRALATWPQRCQSSERERELARIGYWIAFPLVLLCGLFLTVDLNKPDRFWHMLFKSEIVHQALAEGWPGSAASWRTMGDSKQRAVADSGGCTSARLRSRPLFSSRAVVGVAGEMEHGGACVHPMLGKPMRAAIGGGKAVIGSNVKVAAAGALLDVPLGNIVDADDHEVTLSEEGEYLAHPGLIPRESMGE